MMSTKRVIDNATLIERVKMCVAEAGYDPSIIRPITEKWLLEQGFIFLSNEYVIPHKVAWRAKEVSEVGKPKCYVCSDSDRKGNRKSDCAAVRRLEEDCGARFRET
jgi:hypothetical protein